MESGTVGTQEVTEVLEVYPNPFVEELFFGNPPAGALAGLHFSLYNTQGHSVFQGKPAGNCLRLPVLPVGIYFLSRQEAGQGKVWCKRVVKH